MTQTNVSRDLEVLLGYLQSTMNFEQVARQVFERIAHGQGHGLMILQGPPKIANKSFFLKMIKAFERGVPQQAQAYFPDDFKRLLAEVEMSHYEYVDIKGDCPLGKYHSLYRVPLHIALPLSMASASEKRGLKKGRRIVVLCDDLHEFIGHNKETNTAFLAELGALLYDMKEITFLGAYTLDYNGKGLENTELSSYKLALGYD